MPNVSDDINMSRFNELSDGDRDSLRELIQLYIEKTTEQLNALDQAIQGKRAEETARIAHSMVGANAMMGIETILPGLRVIELAAEKGRMDETKTVLKEITEEYRRIQTALKKKLDEPA